MRAGGEAGGVQQRRVGLAEQPAEEVEDASDAVVAGVEGGGVLRLPVGAVGDGDVDQRVEAVVPEDLRVGDGDHVDAEEHPDQVLVDVVVHRPGGLRRAAREVQVHLVAGAGEGHLQLVGAEADPVVADVVGEREGAALLEDHRQQRLHRVVVALQQRVEGGDVGVGAEAPAHLLDPAGGGAAGRHQAAEVGAVPVRHPHLVEDDVQRVLVELPGAVEPEGRDHHALLEDGARVGGHGARRLAADVGHVPEHRGPADHPTLDVDRQHHQPVVGVTDRGAAGVGVGGEQHVTLADVALEAGEEVGDGQPELPDHHLALGVGDQRELVVLLADTGRQRGAEQHLVHLVPRVAQPVLDEVEGDRVDVHLLDRGGRRLDDAGHVRPPARVSREPVR